MSTASLLFVFAVHLLNVLLPASSTYTIRINSNTGNDSSCLSLPSGPGPVPCQSLEHVASTLSGESNLDISIETNIDLKKVVVFKNVSNITIVGHSNFTMGTSRSSSLRRIECSTHPSALFVKNVRNFTISNLEFRRCGAFVRKYYYEVAILFKKSSDITLSHTTVRRTRLTGITFLSCYGEIKLNSVYFYSNGYGRSCLPYPAGASLEITDKKPPVHYSFKDCKFYDNTAAKVEAFPNSSCLCNSSQTVHIGAKGIGGGLGVYVIGKSTGNSVRLYNCMFLRNRANAGGGMYIQFQDFTYNNTIVVERSTFSQNSAEWVGGGAKILYLNYRNLTTRTNKVVFRKVKMFDNSARYGGGLAIASEYGDTRYNPYATMMFYACKWAYNKAVYSPAVDIAPYLDRHSDKSGFLPIPVFIYVNITHNYLVNAHNQLKHTAHINSGVFSITLFTVFLSGRATFTRNSFSALHMTSAIVVFQDNTTSNFHYNIGGNGGAIAMYGFSNIFVGTNTHFEFTGNLAEEYGGGIYHHTIDQHDFINGLSCFIGHIGSTNLTVSQRNITFVFSGNKARSGGSSIYAESFLNCIYSCGGKHNVDPRNKNFVKCIGNFTFNDTLNSNYLQSAGAAFRFRDGDNKEYKVIPGGSYSIPFAVKDEFKQTINPLMNLGLSNPSENTSIVVKPHYTLRRNIYPLGPPNHTATLHFIAQGIVGVYFLFNITTLECPPGFVFSEDNQSCVCSTDIDSNETLYSAILDCNYKTFRARMKRNYWAGYLPPTKRYFENLYFASCFSPFCKRSYSQFSYLPNSTDELDSMMCTDNRTGVVCGQCIANHSVYFHSRDFDCGHNNLCHLGILFYVLSDILPTVGLFLFIVIFDLSFTSGNAVGFIFFCQYLDRLTIHTTTTFSYLRKPYRLFYGIFNFEYFTLDTLSFCLWEGFQILDVIFFKYVTILVAFALVIGLVVALSTNRCGRLFKWRTKISTKTSHVHGLSAFLVICYSQCTKTSFLILKSVTPIGVNGTTNGSYTFYGGLPYLQGKHLVYAVPALLSLVFVTILPPLVLLLYPLSLHLLSLCGLSEHSIVNKTLQLTGINKLKPFIDCFQSCYKDKLRFFAGLYFVYRVVILSCYTFLETYNDYRSSTEMLLLIFLGVHSTVQPYKKRKHNLIDSLIFLNLAMINMISLYSNYFREKLNSSEYTLSAPLMFLTALQLMLLYLPMLASIMYVAVQVCQLLKVWREKRRHQGYEMLDGGERE